MPGKGSRADTVASRPILGEPLLVLPADTVHASQPVNIGDRKLIAVCRTPDRRACTGGEPPRARHRRDRIVELDIEDTAMSNCAVLQTNDFGRFHRRVPQRPCGSFLA